MRILGPLFPFELTRVVRRHRPFTGRCLYVGLLLILLGLTYLSLFPRGPSSLYNFLFQSQANPRELAMFGFAFFLIFTMVQYAVGTFATAGSSSTILAEEKERQTLPFLLTTTLTDREIVFGKVGARLAQIFMVLLAGLPVLALMQMMGGVDPGLLAAAFVATGVTLISTASIGALVSVGATSIKQANSQTIGYIVAYLVLTPLLGKFLGSKFGAVNLIPTSWAAFTVNDLVDWLNSGNFYWAIMRIAENIRAGGKLDDFLWPMLFRYMLFHGLVVLLIALWITRNFRRSLARQSDQAIRKAVKTSSGLIVKGGRRPVSQTRPVLWRETCTAIGRAKEKRVVVWIKRTMFLLSFLPVILTILELRAIGGGLRSGLGAAVHSYVQGVGTMVLCGALMAMANAAAGSMARERRQKTMEELFLTDLTNRELLNQKMLGAVWAARWQVLWVAIHWLIDLVVGGLHPLAIILVWPMFALYSWMAVRIGMALGVRESPRFKPNGVTSLTLLAIAGLPMLLPLVYSTLDLGPQQKVGFVALFAAGMSPPAVLGLFTVGALEWDRFARELDAIVPYLGAGLMLGIVECLRIIHYARRKMVSFFARIRPE